MLGLGAGECVKREGEGEGQEQREAEGGSGRGKLVSSSEKGINANKTISRPTSPCSKYLSYFAKHVHSTFLFYVLQLTNCVLDCVVVVSSVVAGSISPFLHFPISHFPFLISHFPFLLLE